MQALGRSEAHLTVLSVEAGSTIVKLGVFVPSIEIQVSETHNSIQ